MAVGCSRRVANESGGMMRRLAMLVGCSLLVLTWTVIPCDAGPLLKITLDALAEGDCPQGKRQEVYEFFQLIGKWIHQGDAKNLKDLLQNADLDSVQARITEDQVDGELNNLLRTILTNADEVPKMPKNVRYAILYKWMKDEIKVKELLHHFKKSRELPNGVTFVSLSKLTRQGRSRSPSRASSSRSRASSSPSRASSSRSRASSSPSRSPSSDFSARDTAFHVFGGVDLPKGDEEIQSVKFVLTTLSGWIKNNGQEDINEKLRRSRSFDVTSQTTDAATKEIKEKLMSLIGQIMENPHISLNWSNGLRYAVLCKWMEEVGVHDVPQPVQYLQLQSVKLITAPWQTRGRSTSPSPMPASRSPSPSRSPSQMPKKMSEAAAKAFLQQQEEHTEGSGLDE